jgi:hypothetical protein
MEARPQCSYCRRHIDPSSDEAVRAHRRVCLFAALDVTAGKLYPHSPGTVLPPYKNARRKRRRRPPRL